MNTLSAWIFSLSVLPKKWRKVQPETETSGATHLDVNSNDNERPVDLTMKVMKELAYATAQGSFGDVWKCVFSDKDSNVEVAVKCVRIEIQDDSFKKIVSERLMDDFCKWKLLRHDNILSLYGIAYGFGPVPAIVFPWMTNGSLSTYLGKNYDSLSGAHKFSLLADVAAGLQYLHSKGVVHADLTGSNVC
ncbi:kinase-like domain-containing protein [Suillus fuscotomentosus]|uniref:Kinase-like domain-containing protein n=1 Tax=Suillus fuscotomentosus TaxID=1912939 RepID=A0AAD4HIE0_9AGAM|nr:kinase-like domain-containing protein [Suillus fuscotomentosus]KAG1897311.1 kinase-like domain-containing protein [Suillus fuscotomentosus]